jgi:hypothetical protein
MAFDLPGVSPDSDLEILFKAVGFIVVQWGYAEQSLDLLVKVIFECCEGHPLLKRRPQNLNEKVILLRKCFASITKLNPSQAEASALLERFSRVGILRNDLVHSSIVDFTLKDGTFRFLKVDVIPKVEHRVREVRLSDSNWPVLRKDLLELSNDSQSFAKRIFDEIK